MITVQSLPKAPSYFLVRCRALSLKRLGNYGPVFGTFRKGLVDALFARLDGFDRAGVVAVNKTEKRGNQNFADVSKS